MDFAGAGGERLGLGPIRGLRLGAALVAGLPPPRCDGRLHAGRRPGGAAARRPSGSRRGRWRSLRAPPPTCSRPALAAAVPAYEESLSHAHAAGPDPRRPLVRPARRGGRGGAPRPRSIWLVMAVHWGLGALPAATCWAATTARPRPGVTGPGGCAGSRWASARPWSGPGGGAGRLAGPLAGRRSRLRRPARHPGLGSPSRSSSRCCWPGGASRRRPWPAAARLGDAGLELARPLRRHDGDGARGSCSGCWPDPPLLLAAAGIAPHLPRIAPVAGMCWAAAVLGARGLVRLGGTGLAVAAAAGHRAAGARPPLPAGGCGPRPPPGRSAPRPGASRWGAAGAAGAGGAAGTREAVRACWRPVAPRGAGRQDPLDRRGTGGGPALAAGRLLRADLIDARRGGRRHDWRWWRATARATGVRVWTGFGVAHRSAACFSMKLRWRKSMPGRVRGADR